MALQTVLQAAAPAALPKHVWLLSEENAHKNEKLETETVNIVVSIWGLEITLR